MNDQQNWRPVGLTAARFKDTFWAPRIRVNRDATLQREYMMLRDTGRLTSFGLANPDVHIFWDSDVAKWLEAAGYALAQAPDSTLEKQVDDYVDQMERAQMEDGYLNSYYLTKDKDNRWSDLTFNHELYCAGHLFEAAVAYYQATGKRKILDVICRFADHIAARFGRGEGQVRGYCGHPEIELALVRLYHTTSNERYLRLAEFFITERGSEPNFFVGEAQRLKERRPQWHNSCKLDYFQSHAPLTEQATAEGHAVRAAYLYAGLADVARETQNPELLAAAKRLWQNLTQQRMYITGGIGSADEGERLTIDYDLPNEGAHAETCAAIALAMFARRMLDLTLDREYADVMERALYNCMLSGVSLDGCHFFYANRLEVYPELARHGLSRVRYEPSRQEWFGCACCPPNIARVLAGFAPYVASVSETGLALHLYYAGELQAEVAGSPVVLQIATDYPWDGRVQITVRPGQTREFTLALRLPGWCRTPALAVNGQGVVLSQSTTNGYAQLTRIWKEGDVVEVILPMPVERMAANPQVREDAGQVALQRGPLVYCVEECDNAAVLADLLLPRSSELRAVSATEVKAGLPEGCIAITGRALRRKWQGGLYQALPTDANDPCREYEEVELKAVPYALWNNRGEGEMRVWLHEHNDFLR